MSPRDRRFHLYAFHRRVGCYDADGHAREVGPVGGAAMGGSSDHGPENTSDLDACASKVEAFVLRSETKVDARMIKSMRSMHRVLATAAGWERSMQSLPMRFE